MSHAYKTINLSDLISMLQEAEDTFGNLPVVLAGDTEGNDFGIINPDGMSSVEANVVKNHGILCLYPDVDKLDLEEVKGYNEDDYDDEDDDDNYVDELEFDCD